MIFKKKLRNVTAKEYKAWRNEQCMGGACGNCLFHSVCCSTSKNSWVNNKHVYSDWFLDQEIEIEVDNPKLTENEKVILRNVDKKWKYIARNINGKLCLFTEKPTKKMSIGLLLLLDQIVFSLVYLITYLVQSHGKMKNHI